MLSRKICFSGSRTDSSEVYFLEREEMASDLNRSFQDLNAILYGLKQENNAFHDCQEISFLTDSYDDDMMMINSSV